MFLILMAVLGVKVTLLLLFINYLLSNKGELLDIFFVIFNTLSIAILGIIIFSVIVSYSILYRENVNKYLMKINFKLVKAMYPLIINICKFLKISKNDVRNTYIHLNNIYIYSNNYNLNPEDIMILTPHCIQKGSCKHKITNRIQNCIRCKGCDVSDLLDIKEKYKVKVFVATGGTLARKIIKENRPKAIIAVACERDLTSGIQDVEKIPVIGILNERPNGPCLDTKVDIEKIENAINFFLGGV